MSLISRISIRGFRSISSLDLSELAGTNALVGRNSSGKSNILRALNLFFNDQVDPRTALDFRADIHAPLLRSKKRRRIVVEVSFELPSNFKIHGSIPKTIPPLKRTFAIRRTWELDRQRLVVRKTELSVGGEAPTGGPEAAQSILRLIRFRYIPNRVSPGALLEEEGPVLMRAVARRLSGVASTEFVRQMQQAAAQMLAGSDRSLKLAGAPFKQLFADTPTTMPDLLQVTGFRARDVFGAEVPAAAWGYGHQAFFTYHVLKEADFDYSRTFGWRQATIWAVEEPEAGLHRDLEQALAQLLRKWAVDSANRLQLIYTTHSATFAQHCERGFWVQVDAAGTSAHGEEPHRLQHRAQRSGVSYEASPLLAFGGEPLVLVEGHYDWRALLHTAKVLGQAVPRIFSPQMLDPSVADGVSGIKQILARSVEARRLRGADAPVIVLLDWEVSDLELAQVRAAHGAGGARFVVRADPRHANPRLGTDFRGLERFYPTSAIRAAMRNDEIQVAEHSRKPWSVSDDQLHRAKAALCHRLQQVSAPGEFGYLQSVLNKIDDAAALARDSYLTIFADGTVRRASTAPSRTELDSRKDLVLDIAWGSTDETALLFTNIGRALKIPLSALPLDRREPLHTSTPTQPGELPIALFTTDERSTGEFAIDKPDLGDEYEEPYPHFVFCTTTGRLGRLTLWPFNGASGSRRPRHYVRLDEHETVTSIAKVYAEDLVGVASRMGKALAFNPMDLPLRSAAARPVPGIELDPGDEAISVFIVEDTTRAIPQAGKPIPVALRRETLGTHGRTIATKPLLTIRRPLPKLD